VLRTTERAEQILGDLFGAWRGDPARLPENVRERFAEDGEARATADYVAGMTDRFALEEHRRLFGETP
jgi:dGTPase